MAQSSSLSTSTFGSRPAMTHLAPEKTLEERVRISNEVLQVIERVWEPRRKHLEENRVGVLLSDVTMQPPLSLPPTWDEISCHTESSDSGSSGRETSADPDGDDPPPLPTASILKPPSPPQAHRAAQGAAGRRQKQEQQQQPEAGPSTPRIGKRLPARPASSFPPLDTSLSSSIAAPPHNVAPPATGPSSQGDARPTRRAALRKKPQQQQPEADPSMVRKGKRARADTTDSKDADSDARPPAAKRLKGKGVARAAGPAPAPGPALAPAADREGTRRTCNWDGCQDKVADREWKAHLASKHHLTSTDWTSRSANDRKCCWPNCESKTAYSSVEILKRHYYEAHLNPVLYHCPGCPEKKKAKAGCNTRKAFDRWRAYKRHMDSIHPGAGYMDKNSGCSEKENEEPVAGPSGAAHSSSVDGDEDMDIREDEQDDEDMKLEEHEDDVEYEADDDDDDGDDDYVPSGRRS
ncbi:hypothetical protein BD413DRAFT_607672 [Trametes elegans]|nr:hypothetical protein BD413DRAFT_607672 [Trametes elegans]